MSHVTWCLSMWHCGFQNISVMNGQLILDPDCSSSQASKLFFAICRWHGHPIQTSPHLPRPGRMVVIGGRCAGSWCRSEIVEAKGSMSRGTNVIRIKTIQNIQCHMIWYRIISYHIGSFIIVAWMPRVLASLTRVSFHKKTMDRSSVD